MIYIVEDDDNIRKLVSYALVREGYSVKGFSAPKEFWQEIKNTIPELVLLDIMLPYEDGLSILSKLRAANETKNIPIIMLTAKGSEFDKVTGLDMGADDYIAKPFGITELISRVRAVLRRFKKTESKSYSIGSLYVNPSKHIVKVAKKNINLSYKEYLLLITLLEANGDVVRRDKLLSEIWGEFYDESRTLDVHIRKLRIKLEDAGDLIQTVKNVGYKIKGETDE